MKNQYTPTPALLDKIQLPSELIVLAESLAKNVHEVWAQNRIAEGWTYGPMRDDDKKETPCLVPYEDLPEEEKAYDRNTAISTLKYIVSLGYKINADTNLDVSGSMVAKLEADESEENECYELLISEEEFDSLESQQLIARSEEHESIHDSFRSMNRARNWTIRCDCAMLTAWRHDENATREQNDKNNRELQRSLRDYGFGLCKVQGKYPESGEMVKENSFLVYDLCEDKERFFKIIYDLAVKYNQDSFLFKEAGEKNMAYFYKTNDFQSDFFGDKKVKPAGFLKVDCFKSEAYSSIRSHQFAFDGED